MRLVAVIHSDRQRDDFISAAFIWHKAIKLVRVPQGTSVKYIYTHMET